MFTVLNMYSAIFSYIRKHGFSAVMGAEPQKKALIYHSFIIVLLNINPHRLTPAGNKAKGTLDIITFMVG